MSRKPRSNEDVISDHWAISKITYSKLNDGANSKNYERNHARRNMNKANALINECRE